MDLQERLEQCRKDKAAIERQEKELVEQIKKEKEHKFGDIVIFGGNRRVILLNREGKLMAFNNHGAIVGAANIDNTYKKTSENVFKNNMFNLDN